MIPTVGIHHDPPIVLHDPNEHTLTIIGEGITIDLLLHDPTVKAQVNAILTRPTRL